MTDTEQALGFDPDALRRKYRRRTRTSSAAAWSRSTTPPIRSPARTACW